MIIAIIVIVALIKSSFAEWWEKINWSNELTNKPLKPKFDYNYEMKSKNACDKVV